MGILRLLTECFVVVRSDMFGAAFNLVACVWTTIIFGTLKDSGLKILQFYFFSYRNILQNGVKDLSKLVFLKKPQIFVKKLKIMYHLDHTIWFKFCQHAVQMGNK